ncbi:MAG: TetR/AcrR family transcriptional regulator [Thermodesulfobacteriota bacterium]
MDKQPSNAAISRSALRRQREKELRYQTILRAAESLFSKNGYHQTSMEQIADQAEVSTGSVYFYFKNKADLLVHLLTEIGDFLRKLVGTEFRKFDSSMEGFKSAGLVFFREFCLQHPEKVAILFRESTGQSVEVEELRKKLFDQLTTDIRNALVQIIMRRTTDFSARLSVEVMAVCIVGIYERVGYHYLLWQNRSEDILTIGEDAVAFIIGGVEKLIEETSLV